MANFWESFNQSLANTAVPSFAESLKYGNYQKFLEKQQAQEDETKRQKEIAKAQQAMVEQENENLMISNLLGGKIPEAEKAGYMTNLNDNSLRRYLSIQKSLEPPKQKPLKINYNYPTIHTQDPETGELKDTGQPNDKYIPKLDKTEGWDTKTGEKLMVYVNPITKETETVRTGLYKDKSGDTVVKNPKEVVKNVKYFRGILKSLDTAPFSKEWRNKEYQNYTNDQRYELEQDILYSSPSKVQGLIQDTYDEIKKRGLHSPELMDKYQKELKQLARSIGVKARATDKFTEEELGLFGTWADTKFGYHIKDQEK